MPPCTAPRTGAAIGSRCSTRPCRPAPPSCCASTASCARRSSAPSSSVHYQPKVALAHGRDHRRRGAAALAPPRAGPGAAVGVHRRGRGHRLDRADRPVGARGGRTPGSRLGRPDRCRLDFVVAVNLSARQTHRARPRRARRRVLARHYDWPADQPHPRADREHPHRRWRRDARCARGSQAPRREARHRRLRHRLLVAVATCTGSRSTS